MLVGGGGTGGPCHSLADKLGATSGGGGYQADTHTTVLLYTEDMHKISQRIGRQTTEVKQSTQQGCGSRSFLIWIRIRLFSLMNPDPKILPH